FVVGRGALFVGLRASLLVGLGAGTGLHAGILCQHRRDLWRRERNRRRSERECKKSHCCPPSVSLPPQQQSRRGRFVSERGVFFCKMNGRLVQRLAHMNIRLDWPCSMNGRLSLTLAVCAATVSKLSDCSSRTCR